MLLNFRAPANRLDQSRLALLLFNAVLTIKQVPAPASQTGYSCGQQLEWSSQQVADSIGQQPQPKQNCPYWYTQQHVLPAGQEKYSSHSVVGFTGGDGPGFGGFWPVLIGYEGSTEIPHLPDVARLPKLRSRRI
ncbi:chromophore lyase CpcT/CpeT 2 [Striga asiatica]|uniref:Chromophore lyase CpcT/CpeT 2 n=1 Tax=Striga asiatica TaxID=4170 RepID=A0A5A7QB79_STRAF|nr:chromophore lyase CpcT/CpeT 2 [Striga asiatica]